jgi:hypothetical protein
MLCVSFFLRFLLPPLDFTCGRTPVFLLCFTSWPQFVLCFAYLFAFCFIPFFSFHHLPVSCFLICTRFFFIFEVLSSCPLDLPLSDPLQCCSVLLCFALNFVSFYFNCTIVLVCTFRSPTFHYLNYFNL